MATKCHDQSDKASTWTRADARARWSEVRQQSSEAVEDPRMGLGFTSQVLTVLEAVDSTTSSGHGFTPELGGYFAGRPRHPARSSPNSSTPTPTAAAPRRRSVVVPRWLPCEDPLGLLVWQRPEDPTRPDSGWARTSGLGRARGRACARSGGCGLGARWDGTPLACVSGRTLDLSWRAQTARLFTPMIAR